MPEHENGDQSTPLPTIVVTFNTDGTMNIKSEGCGSGQFFIASKMLDLMGEQQFMKDQALSAGNRLAIPGLRK